MERDLRVEDEFLPHAQSFLVTHRVLSVHVIELLPLRELRNAALCCRNLYDYVTSNPSLSWRFKLVDCSEVLSLYAKEDSLTGLPGAPPSAAMSELQRSELRETHSKAQRNIIFSWLVDVQIEYKLSVETLHTSFQLVDRLSQLLAPPQGPYMGLLANKLQLVAITSLSIATKFCEVNTRISRLDLIWLCDLRYTSGEHRAMELHVLQTLHFRMHTCTPIFVIETLAVVLQLSRVVEKMASYMCDLTMIETDALGVQPSSIAAACVIVAMHNLKLPESVPQSITFQQVAYVTRTGLSELRLLACTVQRLHLRDFFVNGHGACIDAVVRPPSVHTPLCAVFERYSSFSGLNMLVARIQPRPAFLLTCGHTHHCGWCGQETCARETKRSMGCFIEQFPAPLSSCGKAKHSTNTQHHM